MDRRTPPGPAAGPALRQVVFVREGYRAEDYPVRAFPPSGLQWMETGEFGEIDYFPDESFSDDY